MWIYFVGENINFAISLLAGIAFLSAGWLYFDAGKNSKTVFVALGHVFIGLSFFIQAVFPNHWLFHAFFVLGITVILTYLSMDKIQPKPSIYLLPFLPTLVFNLLNPLLALSASFLFWRKAIKGLEMHLLPLFRIYTLLALSEIFALQYLFADTQNSLWFPIMKTYGVFWLIRQVLLLFTSILLSRWVFNYLLKRLQTQVFIFLNFFIAVIFVATTFSFSALIFQNLQNSILRQTTIETQMFNNYLQSQKSQLVSNVQTFTQSSVFLQALKNNDKPTLATISAQFLLDKQHSSLVVTDTNGVVLARGENDISGDSISNLTESTGFIKTVTGLELQTILPLHLNNNIIGTVITTHKLDSTYLNRYTSNTNQNLLLISNSQIVASSIKPESLIGLQIPSRNPTSLTLLGQDYYASYFNLTDSDNITIGLLTSVLPVTDIVNLATQTLRTAFLIILGLETLCLIPAFLIARYLESQYR